MSIFLLFPALSNSQNGFRFLKEGTKKERVKFKLINNLIVIPIEINGQKLSFILDTGVSKTILFNLAQNESIGLKNVEKVMLKGLGEGNPVEALISKNNTIKCKDIAGFNETIYVILKDYFDLSSKMGTTIHGIIGYNILSNFVLKINYNSKYIDFYKAEDYQYKKCRKCEVFPIRFYRRKPFINLQVQLDTIGEELTDVKVLVDSGGSEAIWLFEHTKSNIITPKKYFKDILGEGLSGTIYGHRSRLPKLKLKSFEFENTTVSFLDTLSTINARVFKERNGSIGSNILRRFIVWLDYPNKQITLKKNGSFKSGFNYNMSGLEVVYNGKQLVKQQDYNLSTDSYGQSVDSGNSINLITSYSYNFKPSYRIKSVVKDSPGDVAGIKKGDIILRLNNKPAYEYKLREINEKFQEKDGKKIRLIIERNGKRLKFQFKLKKKV